MSDPRDFRFAWHLTTVMALGFLSWVVLFVAGGLCLASAFLTQA